MHFIITLSLSAFLNEQSLSAASKFMKIFKKILKIVKIVWHFAGAMLPIRSLPNCVWRKILRIKIFFYVSAGRKHDNFR
jgi:hypothetical protein